MTDIEIAWELRRDEPHVYYCISRAPFGQWEYGGKIIYDREGETLILSLFDRHERHLETLRSTAGEAQPIAAAQGLLATQVREAYSKWDG